MDQQQAQLEEEDRVDEWSRSVFADLGWRGRLPDGLVETFFDFKRVKDRVHPGRLSPEGFAFVVCLYRLRDSLRASLGEEL